jgi:LPXTG-motif cell wall-anchored protein
MGQRRIIGGLLSVGGTVLLAVGLTATVSGATPTPACPYADVQQLCDDHWPTTTEQAAVESSTPPTTAAPETTPAPTVAPTTAAPSTAAPTTAAPAPTAAESGAIPPTGGSSGTLPATGADQHGIVVLGALCLGAGGLTLLLGRRRPTGA